MPWELTPEDFTGMRLKSLLILPGNLGNRIRGILAKAEEVRFNKPHSTLRGS